MSDSRSQLSHPIADMSDSLLGWASKSELDLAQRLKKVDVVYELGLSIDELEQIERLYGIFLSRQLAAGASLAGLLSVSPALSLVTIISRAREVVCAQNFAAELSGSLGLALPSVAELEQLIEEFLPAALRDFELLIPGDIDFLTLAAFHAGIVSNEIPALLELIDTAETELDIADLGAQETTPYFSQAAQHSPEYSEKILAGIYALRRFALDHPHSWFDRDRSGLMPKLPTTIDELVVAELRERPVGTHDRDSAVGVAGREMRPRIIYDAQRKKICLRLPQQRLPQLPKNVDNTPHTAVGVEQQQVSWRVSIDSTTKVYRTGRAWGDESGFSEALDISVDHPVRDIIVQDLTHNIVWTVPVINSDNAMLLFSAGGANVSDKVSLHHQYLHVLVPEATILEDIVSGEHITPLSSCAVEGWVGWTCHYVDVYHAASMVAVPQGAKASMEGIRSIDVRQRVMFQNPGEPLPALTSLSGLAVYDSSLLAVFPPTPSGHSETWYLSISSYAGASHAGEEITQPEPLEVPAEGGVFQVFDPDLYDAPWVGEYLVRMRGPRNESFRHEFALVEGAQAHMDIAGVSKAFRIPTGGGLSEATLQLIPGEKEFRCQPQVLSVAPDQAGAELIVSTDEGDQLPLRFTPPRLTFELPLIGEPPMWRASRVVVRPRRLAADGQLRIRAVGQLRNPTVTVRNTHGAPVKTIKLKAADSDLTYVADLAPIAASACVMPAGRIDLEWTDALSRNKVSVTVADLRSEQEYTLQTDPEQPGVMSFSGLTDHSRLRAWVWALTAPWEPAYTLDVHSGVLTLPDNLRNAGNLAIQLHTHDPFMTLRAPITPGDYAYILEQPGHYIDPHDDADADTVGVLTQLSAFLAGDSTQVPDSAEVMPLLWDTITTGLAKGDARKAVQQVLRSQPHNALKGLSESLVPATQQPGKIIETTLSLCIFSGHTVPSAYQEEEHNHYEDIHRAAWIDTLALLGELDSRLSHQIQQEGAQDSREIMEHEEQGTELAAEDVAKFGSAFADETVDPDVAVIVEKLVHLAGENVVEILKTGRDATLDSACIDRSTVAIASMDESQQKNLLSMFFADSRVVPGAIMDEGSRLLAVFEAFNQRECLCELLSSQGLIQPAVTLLRTLRSTNKTLYAMARVRFDKLDGVDTDARDNVWALTPVVSLILALAARMHAHGLITSSKTLDAVTPAWALLADIVPELVTSDMVAAEAMVLAVKHQGISF
ncbi:hypothetical protein EML15_01740 [Corynebacterium sp. sy017]|uniref:hypothetical protein n=1 Tax=unclassified Corynebacterium TaxID=2624378 RepID=UPI001184BEC8|nr:MULTISPECIES: hypothetical protein [unclassified Corynebacterium]MBP3087878.1 hypothetical protein [Corynebacterium sp. sy017]TSD92419.1 hypothetical protein ELY17_01740 [Corynebacterium sp. SY003]